MVKKLLMLHFKIKRGVNDLNGEPPSLFSTTALFHSPRALLQRLTGSSKHGYAAVRHQSNGNLAAEM